MGRHFWWRFRFSMSSGHRERGFLDPRTPLSDTGDVSDFDNPSTCSHSDDRGGTVPSFRHGLHGAVGMIFYVHAVYVVICYMSIICYMPVICLSDPSSGRSGSVWIYIEGPFWVSRTACARERHAPCIEGPFLVNRTGHARERHTPYPNRYMNTSIWDISTSIWDTKLQTGGVEG